MQHKPGRPKSSPTLLKKPDSQEPLRRRETPGTETGVNTSGKHAKLLLDAQDLQHTFQR